ncbi:MAG: glycosyltransferase family 2 protein [Eubacteriales bacterium]|nr:glycosyltransferase family 2 protein [Eubacteriales bacterium]
MNEKTSQNVLRVSVVIPTLNAGGELDSLLSALSEQHYPIEEILIVDSSSEDKTADICRRFEKARMISIPREDFDHGRTRDLAMRSCRGDIVVFLTQDAIPADGSFLEKLIAPLTDPTLAISVGRQLPRKDATKAEAFVRDFNYPPASFVRSKEDIPRLGIKAFFCSDSCAAYRKDIYLKLGGFEYPIKTNEDMFYAAKVLQSGYRIAYTAEAMVYHSHNFTLRQQYRRNYIQGYEIERHRDLLGGASLDTEGLKLVRSVSGKLLKEGAVGSFLLFGLDCCARWLGNRNGKAAYRREARHVGDK